MVLAMAGRAAIARQNSVSEAIRDFMTPPLGRREFCADYRGAAREEENFKSPAVPGECCKDQPLGLREISGAGFWRRRRSCDRNSYAEFHACNWSFVNDRCPVGE